MGNHAQVNELEGGSEGDLDARSGCGGDAAARRLEDGQDPDPIAGNSDGDCAMVALLNTADDSLEWTDAELALLRQLAWHDRVGDIAAPLDLARSHARWMLEALREGRLEIANSGAWPTGNVILFPLGGSM